MAVTTKAGARGQKATQVLLVDDHPLVRRGVAELINGEPDMAVCGEASTMQEALALLTSLEPQLLIVDVSLAGNSGMDLMKHLAGLPTAPPVLAYSMHDESIYAERCLRAGAKGYVMKHAPPETLLQAIRQILSGKTYLSKPMSERLLQKFVGAGKTSGPLVSPIDKLSDRELEVLQLLGKGQTTSQMAEQLCLSVKTVETYREHVKQKLNLANGPELLRYAIEWSLSCAAQ